MRFDANISELLPAPADEVWAALTDSDALADWLMPNDFLPEVGRAFEFVPDHETPWDGNVACEVLDLVPKHRMLWSWKTSGMEAASLVEFVLEPRSGGTQLTIRHRGDADDPVGGGLEGGWPDMLGQLSRALKRR